MVQNDLLSSLKAESEAAAAEMDKQYLQGLNVSVYRCVARVFESLDD